MKRIGSGLLVLWLGWAGCTDSLPRLEEESDGEPPLEGLVERVHPKLTILEPLPGSYLEGTEVVLRGEIEAGSGELTRLLVNGDPVSFWEDRFEAVMPLKPGPNIFGVRLEAEDMGRAVDAVSVYGPSVHPPGTVLEEGLRIRLGQEFLDNDTAELDDLARILEALLEDDRFLASFFEEPIAVTEDTVLTVERVEISEAEIDLRATPGCLDTEIILRDVELDLRTSGAGALLGEVVWLRAASVGLRGYLCPEGAGGTLELEVYEPEVSFEAFRLSTNNYPNLAEDLPGIHDPLAEMAESGLEVWLGDSLAELLLEFLDGFVGDYSFGTAPEVRATFRLESVRVDSRGVSLGLSGSFSAEPGLMKVPEGVGSLRTDDEPLREDFTDGPVAIGMSDDLLNQLLFAIWYGGGIGEYELPAEELSALPEVFQPIREIEVELELPPTFLPSSHPEEYAFDMAAAGIGVDLLAGEDRRFEMGIHVRAGVGVSVDEEGMLNLELDNRARRIRVEAGVATAPEPHDRGDLAALVRLMVPSILGEVGVSYGGFPIPSLELSTLSENLGGFEGRRVGFRPTMFRREGRGGGYLVVEGAVREVGGDVGGVGE